MPGATASGADAGGSNTPFSREHKQGNQGRTYTEEQKAAVLRIRRCNATAFYDILGLESVKTSCSDSEIKKAYRKQSLLTHPDKNGHEHADEAFKMVSRAFGILGDKEKREKFDKFGGDPDSRFGAAQAQNPFSGFARRDPSGGMGGMGGGMGGRGFETEMTAEEMFARFFGGGGGGPFGGFDTGPQFMFNFGGGPGIRVHQFGGNRPRRRPRDPAQGQQEQQQPNFQNLIGLLPIIIFFILPMLTSLFNGVSTGSSTPHMVFDNPWAPYTEGRATPNLNVPYFVNPVDVSDYSPNKFKQLDRTAEVKIVQHLRAECDNERQHRTRLREAATGWFYQDPEKMRVAMDYKMKSCERMDQLGIGR